MQRSILSNKFGYFSQAIDGCLTCKRLRHSRRSVFLFTVSCLLIIFYIPSGLARSLEPNAVVAVSDNVVGRSTRYIGACEGSVKFELADLADLNVNTYRIYGGMSRWEFEDDDGIYGFPTIAQIKQNPSIIPWEKWDSVMTHPKAGTDYAFAGTSDVLWQGSARTLFESLKQGNIRPVVSIRNADPGQNPTWATALNPPRTELDWNEWWEHVFATVYWLNVRNDYHVDDFEIHNEPDNPSQGWNGTQEDYFDLTRVASDAISYVYASYLPERTFHIHAPKTTGSSTWPRDALARLPDSFNSVNIHNYNRDVTLYLQRVRDWMNHSSHANAPLWVGEWGTYTDGYDNLEFSLNLIKNMIRMSQPGDTYVDGSHLFSLYDWWGDSGFKGLIDAEGNRRLSYYAFRMGIRALQGGRDVLRTTYSDPDLAAIATFDSSAATLSLLLVNSALVDQWVTVDLPDIGPQSKITTWEFSQRVFDEVVEEGTVSEADRSSAMTVLLPAQSSRLIQIN